MTSLGARVVWGSMYVGVGAAIGWYRFVTPARQAARHRLRVLSVQPEGPGVVSIVITGRHLAELRAEAGQFFRWRFLSRGLCRHRQRGQDQQRATPAPSSTGSSTGGSSTASAKTVTGDPADTMYGPVQVQITVKNGKLAGVDAIEYPTETPHDEQINAYAIPQLTQEALAAGSAKIDAVSGASYTSQGYITSLQSALDKAGI
jgi:uncharacterized protein with FMN-binding domain